MPVVKRQIRNKQFTQDIIDTLGRRFLEVKIAIPRDPVRRQALARETQTLVEMRVRARNRATEMVLEAEGIAFVEAGPLLYALDE